VTDTQPDVSPRLQQFQTEVDQLKVTGGRANPERTWVIVGALLMVVGVVITLISYTSTHSSDIQAEWADYNVLSNFGLALTIVGSVLFLVMSLRRYLRYWLIRLIYEQRDAVATDLIKSIQLQLDRLNAGIIVVNVNVGNVQVPEQVQAAFNDAVKAGADRDRFKNEGQAYAADVIPKAQGTAARLKQEADGYRSRVIAEAEGDAQRFRSVLTEYQKAPAVTRDRLYLETMQSVYANVSKVMVESRSGSNLLYLPLDRLLQQAAAPAVAPAPATPAAAPTGEPTPAAVVDPRSRDGARTRDRDGR